MSDKAFRHGDIEEILTEIAKTAGRVAGGGGLFGFATSVLSAASGGSKFSKDDVKKVYFVGQWFLINRFISLRCHLRVTGYGITLRYSYYNCWMDPDLRLEQAMDIAGLTKLSADTLVLIVSVLGFLVRLLMLLLDVLNVTYPTRHSGSQQKNSK